MKTMLFKKMTLAALVFALILAAFPLTGVFAAGQADDPLPPTQEQGPRSARLEKIWARMNHRYERLGKFFDKSDALVDKANRMIERLKEAGESTSELEAALSAYEAAVKQAHPIYESCNGIVTSHQGFDADGKVTDAEQAKETVKDLGAKFGEIYTAMNGTGRDLIELMRSIRDAHRPAITPTPSSADGAN
jgi:cytochrome c556